MQLGVKVVNVKIGGQAPAPVDEVVGSVSDPLEAITYTYKSVVQRRSGYKNSQGEHKTVPLPLKGPDLRELLPFLARYKAGARLILYGVRRDGKRLRRTHRKDRHRPATEIKNAAAA
jgi:hypothetical protein